MAIIERMLDMNLPRRQSAFIDECAPCEALIVCTESAERIHEGITILPWRLFLHDLREGKIIG